MKTILIRGCLRVRSTRGSLRSWKWSWNEADALRAMMTIRQGQSVSSPNAWPWLYNGALAQSTGHRYFDAEPALPSESDLPSDSAACPANHTLARLRTSCDRLVSGNKRPRFAGQIS